MIAPPSPSPSPRGAAAHVLSDRWLLRHTVSFLPGLPWPLYAFWLQHDPQAREVSTRPYALSTNLKHLVALVVAHGTPQLLKLVPRAHCRSRLDNRFHPLRLERFDLAHLAIANHRADILAWAIDSKHVTPVHGPEVWWTDAIHHYRVGDLTVLELLQTHVPSIDTAVFENVCYDPLASCTDITLLRWLHTHQPTAMAHCASTLLQQATQCGNLAVVRFVHEEISPHHVNAQVFVRAGTNLDVLAYLIEQRADALRDSREGASLQRKIAADRRPAAQALIQKYPHAFRLDHLQLLEDAVRRHDVALIESSLKSGLLAELAPISIDEMANHKDALPGIRLLHEYGVATATTDAMDHAAEAGAWDLVDFLAEHRTEGCTRRAMDAVVKHGDVERVRRFCDTFQVGCSASAVTFAAEAHSIEILQCLDKNPNAEFTSEVMDAAAAKGRLAVVIFLHTHRSEGCSTAAVDKAAEAGHHEVVQFLLTNRTDGFTTHAIVGALRNGHVRMVWLLYDHSPGVFGPAALHALLLYGLFDIYMSLRDRYPDEAEAVVEKVLFAAGKEIKLPTIRFIIDVLGNHNLAHRAVDGAAWNCDRTWLRAVLAVTGPASCRFSAVRIAIDAHEIHCDSFRWDYVLFLIQSCTDPHARDLAIAIAQATPDYRTPWFYELLQIQRSTSTVLPPLAPLHPLLTDPRSPSWAIQALLNDDPWAFEERLAVTEPRMWPVLPFPDGISDSLAVFDPRAVYDPDRRQFHQSIHASSFHRARTAALRQGNTHLFQWLVVHGPRPLEPTVLGEALYHHRFELAEWLVVHYPSACTVLDWSIYSNEPSSTRASGGLNRGLLDWLADHETVRQVVPFIGIIDYAARQNDVASLERLYEWHPELFTPRPSLIALADREECSDTINLLLEIGWDPEVFLGDF